MYTLGKPGYAVAAGVPSSNSQPTRLPLQTAAIFCLYEPVNPATFHFVTKFDLRHEDCIEGMSPLADESVDVVVTSPPYNLGISYGKYSDRQDRQSYLRWCHGWAEQVRRILKPTGSFFLNIGAAPSNPMLPHEIVIELRNLFVLQNTIHWVKSIAIEDRKGDLQSHGHFKPISSKRFVNDCHEYVFHFTKTGRVELDRLSIGVPYQDKSNIARWSHTRGSDLRCRGNTWFIPYLTIQSRAKDDRTRRRFLFSSRNGASNCMVPQARDAFKRCSIRFWGLEIPQSPRSAAA